VGLSLAVVFVTTALSLGAAAWLFSEKEYVLEQ
jgi:ABC-type transport system involved in multi-copper enzyme maturation permease subunit